MHREASIGTPKAVSLAQAVRCLNSAVQVSIHNVQFDNKVLKLFIFLRALFTH